MCSYKASVIICTAGRKTLRDCLESLLTQTYRDFEVIVIGINQRSKNLVSKFGFKFILSPKANSSFQRNLGIKKAEGELVAFTDDDAVADREWLKILTRHYNGEEIVCVGGKIIPKFSTEIPTFLKQLPEGMFKGFIGETLLNFEEATVIDKPLLWGCNLSFRKSIFDDVGLFDETLGRTPNKLISEDETDLQRRILKRGFKLVYEPKAVVTHLIDEERLTKKWFLERSFWQGYSEILRIRNQENFEKLWKEKSFQTEFFKYISFIKSMEILFEMIGTDNLKKKLDVARKLGRVAAFKSLLER
ncbi:MAG: glycosyltransferase [Candidatus Aenigmarchaeota archaeon]|nr:glycosyltransferase [Candidatus Aenigmarchaeota archaeon]